MAAYDKADLERRMHGAVEALKHDLQGLRTGPCLRPACSIPLSVEVYGSAHAAQPGRAPLSRTGAAPAVGPGLGQVQCRPGRQGDPIGRARPQPDRRWADAPHPDPRSDRGAPQGTRQARQPICRERRGSPHATSAATATTISKTDEKKGEISEDERKRSETEVQKLTDSDDRRYRCRRCRQGKGNPGQVSPASASPMPDVGGSGSGRSAPCRYYHGRQWPLGEEATCCRALRAIAPEWKRYATRSSAAGETRYRGADAFTLSRPRTGGVPRPRLRILMGLLRFYLRREVVDLDQATMCDWS